MNVFLSKFSEGYLPLTVPTIKCQPKMYLKNGKFFFFFRFFAVFYDALSFSVYNKGDRRAPQRRFVSNL